MITVCVCLVLDSKFEQFQIICSLSCSIFCMHLKLTSTQFKGEALSEINKVAIVTNVSLTRVVEIQLQSLLTTLSLESRTDLKCCQFLLAILVIAYPTRLRVLFFWKLAALSRHLVPYENQATADKFCDECLSVKTLVGLYGLIIVTAGLKKCVDFFHTGIV